MEIGVAAYLKKINKSLVLSKIIKHGLISRSELANITKLTKATISSQTAELLEEGLIIESIKSITKLEESRLCFHLINMLVMS